MGDKEIDVIIATGLGQPIHEIGKVPRNIILTEWVPATQLIKECDLFIHHGGHGSCMLSLTNGVPSIVIPTFSEREFNARQLKKMGTGTFITLEELSPESIWKEVNISLNNKVLMHNVKEWANTLKNRNYGGAEEAQKAILEIVASHVPLLERSQNK